jgi:GntR family transcriptional regulator
MNIQPDAASSPRGKPVYVRIQDHVRAAMASGTLGPGDRLWTEADLAREFQTTRATVRHALDQLVFEGLISRQAGRGSFVAQHPPLHAPLDFRRCLSFEEQMALTGKTVRYRAVSYSLTKAPPQIENLFQSGADVFKLERLRVVDDHPVCLEMRYIPPAIGSHVTGEMLSALPAHTFVADILGEVVPTILVSITAEIADAKVKKLLELSGPSAVSVRTANHYNAKGKVVLSGRCIFAGHVTTDYVLGSPLVD